MQLRSANWLIDLFSAQVSRKSECQSDVLLVQYLSICVSEPQTMDKKKKWVKSVNQELLFVALFFVILFFCLIQIKK